MKTDKLRETFLNFLKSKNHKVIASDSLVPLGDPTVLFTPAGMNQFKNEFLGLGRSLKRAATSQRCLRTDDLEKVGKTSSHHTFFEMLGNFSFGDYFKEEAVSWAWEFLTNVLKMDKRRFWISVYKEDDESYEIWRKKINIASERILKLGDKDNFWPSNAKTQGPNGPCGPCSEIFYDLGKNIGCKKKDCSPVCGCGRFVEVWNLVFTQFNRKGEGMLEPLPRKNIDTGMGLERLAAVMQGSFSNFEIDLFQPIIKEIKRNIKNQRGVEDSLIYAVSDHIRAVTFAVYDGVLPSNEERGYVVRKLIRRSIMNLSKVGISRPFLNSLVPIVAQVMYNPYPQLKEQQEDISGIVLAEEKSFYSILDSAPGLLERVFQNKKINSGEAAFQLYDTYGVPVEITSEWLMAQDIKFDWEGFNRLLNQQKERSKKYSSMKGDVFSMQEFPFKTKKTCFIGYKKHEFSAKILSVLKNKSEVKEINEADEAAIILDNTVFYPESGGQSADIGEIKKGGNVFDVTEVKKIKDTILHKGILKSGVLKKNDTVKVTIDIQHRFDVARNHTATHILQSVLRDVLGNHIKQQGSLVAPDRLRFDFTHFKDIDQEILFRIEELVNKHIWDNDSVRTKSMLFEDARKTGALAFFEDKYQKRVRVVSIGNYSSELCGGTHLRSTGSIGLFKIVSEGSVSAGVRRIEAVTGRYAYSRIYQQQRIVNDVSSFLKVPYGEVVKRVEKLLNDIKELQKRKSEVKTEQLQLNLEDLIGSAEDVSGIKLLTRFFPDAEEAQLRGIVDAIKKKISKSICLLGTNKGNKAVLVLGITKDLVENTGFKAGELIRDVAAVMCGSGGGREDFAFGSGEIEKIASGFERLKYLIQNKQ